jgi:signal transduction histidine kinase
MMATEPTSAQPATPATVLVVDDNSINRYMLAQNVTQLGHTAVQASNGREALDKLHAAPCDLVLLDIMMPEMDGYAVLEAMKADEKLRDIPVVMVSGVEEIKSVVRCIERGAEDYINKPFEAVVLRARVNACLERKRLRDQQRQKTEELERTLAKLKATQEQLVLQEKLASLGALTAGIAHEIKNPLNFVMNFAQLSTDLVREVREEVEKQKDHLDAVVLDDLQAILGDLDQNVAKINEHGKRADSIVKGMLAHSRGGKGELQLTDLNALLDEYVKLAYHGLRAQDISFNVALELDLDRTLKPVSVIAQDLSRVFLNIANNACYAANEKKKKTGAAFAPKVSARTKDLGDKVEIRIRDNGDGVPQALRDKIFNPFFTTKPTGAGTGLGLSISYDIVVQEHRGTLRLESEEGQYAEFVITLPKNA